MDEIELTKTERENAESKYEAVGNYLTDKMDCEFYPQGSFATHTIIRPLKTAKRKEYDLDAMVQFKYSKASTAPKEIKKELKQALLSSGVYRDKLHYEEWDKCWTLDFANVNDDTSFSMDLVPAVLEDELIRKITYTPYSDTLGSITNKNNSGEYFWVGNNSKGFANWFINQGKNLDSRIVKNILYRASADVSPLAGNEINISLSRVVKILKRHRDIYYEDHNINDYKPASAIILASAGLLAERVQNASSELDVLQKIVQNLMSFQGKSLFLNDELYLAEIPNGISGIISRNSGRWEMLNPTDSRDNLLDAWNGEEGAKISRYFFEWVSSLSDLLPEFEDMREKTKERIFYENFGIGQVQKSVPEVDVNNPLKPWRQS